MTNDEMKRAVAEVVKTAGTDPRGKSAMAELIVRMAEPQHLSLSLFRAFMRVTTLQPGDEIQLKVRKSRYPVR